MKNQTIITNPTPACIISDRRRRALAIIAAQERGQYVVARTTADPAVIALPPFLPSNTEAAPEVIRAAYVAAFLAIRARHQASGLDFLRRLNLEQSRDRQRENLPTIAAEALTARAEHAQHHAAADLYNAIADRATAPAEQRDHAAQLAKEHRAAADRSRSTYERLERVIATTSHSDRADIVQAAAVAMWETGNFTEACKAAGKAIGAIAAANGCTATRTKVRPITKEQADAIRADYYTSATKVYNQSGELVREEDSTEAARIPFKTREGLTAGYTTIEYRNSKQFPAGWYEVKHYHTAAPCISYEVFATNEDSPELVKNDGINIITNQQAAEDIAALIDRAKFSHRERETVSAVLAYMMDNTAAAAGARAVAAHMAETAERVKAAKEAGEATAAAILAEGAKDATERATKERRKAAQAARQIQRRADERTEEIRAAAMRENAFHRAGVYSDRTQRDLLSRIRAKLTAAKAEPIKPTAAERAEQERRQWQCMQSNRNRYSRYAGATTAPDVVPEVQTIIDTGAGMKPTEYAAMRVELVQTVDPATLHTITEQERQTEEAHRIAHIRAHAADVALLNYRRQMRDHKPTRTAYAAHDAIAAAYVFYDHMNRADQMKHLAPIAAEEAAEAAQRAAEARAKANAAKGEKKAGLPEAAREVEAHAARLAQIAAAIARAAQE